ncbi:uncharacterized protein LOC132278318 [Cornus florida]|uniref:uncharacterized protein LOC132278318 n=1 Tax=Cornus florida TaxID=4283 RepID=UPI00289B4D14|nr:uncharacterized protein LOC132278318 [Cornus florida]
MVSMEEEKRSGPTHGETKTKAIGAAIMALIMLIFIAYLFLWVMVPTHIFRQNWSPKIQANSNSTYFGSQGYNFLLYTFPILFMAILGSVYLHLGNKVGHDNTIKSNNLRRRLASWKRPMIIKGPGIVSGIELAFFVMFIALLLWIFANYLHFFFARIGDSKFSRWEAKLGRVALTLGIVGNVCLVFLFFPVTRGSSVLPLFGLTSEASIKYHIWLGHIAMLLFTTHGVLYIAYWAATHQLSKVLKWSNNHVSNVAGELSLLFGLVLWVTTYPSIRRKFFELFFYTHYLYILFIIFFVFHLGISYSGMMLPGFYLFLIDRYLRFLQSRQCVRLLSARILPCETVELNFSKSPGLSYTPTSILFMNVPSISKLQWHPFTISSNSNLEPDKISVIIKNEGSWSKKLYQMLSAPSPVSRLNVSIEGPYGPISTHFLRHDTLVMVSGGSGIAPLISIIRELIFMSTTLKCNTPKVLLISAFRHSSDLAMLDLILPLSGIPTEFPNLELQIEAYVTREKEPTTENRKLLRPIWFDSNASDVPLSPILGRNSWLWLGAIISSSFIIFLIFVGILTRYYIYPIDHNTNKIYSHSARAAWNLLLICICIAMTASAAFLWNKKQLAMEAKQIQSMEGSTPLVSSESGFYNADKELESVPHQSLVQSTKVHYGERPNLKRTLFECKSPSVGVLVCGPKTMRHEVAAICSSGLAANLHFESISFSWVISQVKELILVYSSIQFAHFRERENQREKERVSMEEEKRSAPTHGGTKIKAIGAAIMALIMLIFIAYLFLWVMLPTHTYLETWSTKILANSNSTYFGSQGYNILVYTFPILFMAVLGCMYLHMGKKTNHDNTIKSNNLRHRLGKRPVIIKGLGIVSWIELALFIMFIALLLWIFSKFLQFFFADIGDPNFSKGDKLWEAKLERVALNLGIVGNVCLAFLFFPVTRGSSVLPLFGLTSEGSIKYHIWLGHIAMALFTAHGVLYIVYWSVTHRLSEVLKWYNTNVSNVAGELSLLFGLVLWVTTYPSIRRKFFELFFYTHYLYTLFIIFFIFHLGFSYACIMLPGFYLFLIDRYLRFLQSRQRVRLVSARILPCETVELNFSKSPGLSYTPTSILFMNVPTISKLQWHPFTISSNSNLEPDKISVIIKNEGGWSKKLYQMLSVPSPVTRLNVSIEGPYGPVSTHFLRHDTLVMVSGGSGIAPLISIIRELIFMSTTLKCSTPTVLIISAFRHSSDLTMLDLILPLSGIPTEFPNLQLQIEAYVTREREPTTENRKLLRPIWFDSNASDVPLSPILGRNSWLWLGAIISSSFIIFLIFVGILIRYYIYTIDHNTDKIYSYSARAVWNMLLICISIAMTASAAFLWNKKQLAMEAKQIQNMEGSTPVVSSESGSYNVDKELESLPRQSLVQSTNVHYGERPNLKRTLFECKSPSVGVLVCGPKTMRHEVAAICSSGLASNLHFESISFSW